MGSPWRFEDGTPVENRVVKESGYSLKVPPTIQKSPNSIDSNVCAWLVSSVQIEKEATIDDDNDAIV